VIESNGDEFVIPILGQLDDLLIVPGLIYAALAFIPPSVKNECRNA